MNYYYILLLVEIRDAVGAVMNVIVRTYSKLSQYIKLRRDKEIDNIKKREELVLDKLTKRVEYAEAEVEQAKEAALRGALVEKANTEDKIMMLNMKAG